MISSRPYRVGEVVLLQWHGWLKAFRVVEVNSEKHGDIESVEYKLAMVELEKDSHLYQWKRPTRD